MTKQNLEFLDTDAHRDLRVDTKDYSSEANQVNRASIVMSELGILSNEYPIFIAKTGKPDDYMLLALLGFDSRENLYIEGKKWNATYIPLEVLSRPFHVYMPEGGDNEVKPLAIDRSSPQVQGTYGEEIFTPEGKVSPYLERIQQIFSELMSSLGATQHFIKRLDELELLEDVTIQVPSAEGDNYRLTGISGISESKLQALSGEALESAHKDGTLLAATLIMNSKMHIEKLQVLKQAKNAAEDA